MTLAETETIGCPACHVQQDVDVYQTINAMENPELVQRLVAGEINVFKCAGCGHGGVFHGRNDLPDQIRDYLFKMANRGADD